MTCMRASNDDGCLGRWLARCSVDMTCMRASNDDGCLGRWLARCRVGHIPFQHPKYFGILLSVCV